MRVFTRLLGYMPLVIVAAVFAVILAMASAFFGVLAVSFFTSRFALGIDFAIFCGLAFGGAAGVWTFLITLKKGRVYVSK